MHEGKLAVKQNGLVLEEGDTIARDLGNPIYTCYPETFDLPSIKSYSRHDKERRIERTQKRRDKRNRSYDNRPHGDATCPYCNGQMSWCGICRMYSSNCCEDWGTCQCS